jgi:hypothetical protein
LANERRVIRVSSVKKHVRIPESFTADRHNARDHRRQQRSIFELLQSQLGVPRTSESLFLSDWYG